MKQIVIEEEITKKKAIEYIKEIIYRFQYLIYYFNENKERLQVHTKLLRIVEELEIQRFSLLVNSYFVNNNIEILSSEGCRDFLLKLKELNGKLNLNVFFPKNLNVVSDDIIEKFITKLTSRAFDAINANIALLPEVEKNLKEQANKIDITKPLGELSEIELCILKQKQYREGVLSRPDLYQRQNGLLENGYTKEYNDIQAKLDAIEKLPKDYPLIRFLSGSTDSTTVKGEIEKAVRTVSDAQNKIKELIEEGKFPVWELEELVEAEKATYTDPKEIAEIDAWLKKQKTNKKIKDLLMTLVPIGLSLIVFFIPGGASLLLLGIKAGAQILNAGLGAVSAYQDFQDAKTELLRSNADVILSDAQIDLLQSQGKDAAVLQFFLVFISAIGTAADIADSARLIRLYNKADNIGALARKRLQQCKVKSTVFQDLSEEQLITLSLRLEQEQFDEIAKLPSNKVVQFLDDTRDFSVTKEVLKKSECSPETLKLYLQSVDQKNGTYYVYIYEKTGYWPDNIQIPSKGDFLTNEGKIDWNKWAPNGGQDGKVLIGEDFAPKKGSLIDRYGSENGNYVSPMLDGKPFTYEQRALPYIEDKRQYHKYEVQYDSIFDCIKCIKDEQTRNVLLNEYKTIAFSNNKSIFSSSKIAPAFNQKGGGIQYEFGFNIKTLIKIGYLKEI